MVGTQSPAPFGAAAPGMQQTPVRPQHTFMIKHTDENGRTLEGQFTTRRLSIREFNSVTVRKVQMNGGYYYNEKSPGQGIDENTDYTNHMMATLEYCLVQKPLWFDLNTLTDLNLLVQVYRECTTFENSFASPQRGAAVSVGSSQAGGGGASAQSGTVGSVAEVGGGQVPVALDP